MDVKFTLGLDFPNLPYYMEKNVICVLLDIWPTLRTKSLDATHKTHSGEPDWHERDPPAHRSRAQLVRELAAGDGAR